MAVVLVYYKLSICFVYSPFRCEQVLVGCEYGYYLNISISADFGLDKISYAFCCSVFVFFFLVLSTWILISVAYGAAELFGFLPCNKASIWEVPKCCNHLWYTQPHRPIPAFAQLPSSHFEQLQDDPYPRLFMPYGPHTREVSAVLCRLLFNFQHWFSLTRLGKPTWSF